MKLPIVQEFTQITAGMRILEMTGITPLIRYGFILQGVLANWGRVTQFVITQFNALRAIIGGVIAWIGGVGVAASQTGLKLLAAWAPQGKALQALKHELSEVATQLGTVGSAAQVAGGKIGSLQNSGAKLGNGIVNLIIGFIKFNALMLLINATLSWLLERFAAWKESQDKIASDKRAEEALRRLDTTYRDLGETASASAKRAKEFEEAIVNTKYDEAFENLKKIEKELKGINDLLDRKQRTTVFEDIKAGAEALLGELGKVWRLLTLITNAKPIKSGAKEDTKVFGIDIRSFTDEGRKEILQEQEIAARKEVNKWARSSDSAQVRDKIRLETENRTNLEKEITELRRQQENDIFQLRQSLAQKEVEIFRAAGELRIFQMEQANKKLVEGQEGVSATALDALNTYLSTRERGELDIEAAKKSLVIEAANLEKQIADYKYDLEKKIFDLRKRANENELASAQASAAIRAGEGSASGVAGSATDSSTISQAIEATRNLTGTNKQCAEAVKRFMGVLGVNASVMDRSAVSAERMGQVMTDWSQLRPGDIVARGRQGAPAHVGVYTGGNDVFHQSATRGLTAGNYPDLGYFKQQGYFIRPRGMSGMTSGGSDFRSRYLMRMSNLEGGYGLKGAGARNPSSNARGFFQLIPSTEKDLRRRGKGELADRFLSKDFSTAASAAYDYAVMMRPASKQLFAEGDVAGLDRLLNRLWTSLPGGKEEASGQRLAKGNAYLQGGGTRLAAGALQGRSDIPDVNATTARYAEAVRSLSGAMERLRALQEALTNAKTAAAFEEIAKAAFPKVGLEQYRDQIIEAEKTLEALASTANEAYDPERLKIAVEQITKRKIQEDEIKQILNKAEQQRKAGRLTEVEFNKLKDSLSQKQKLYLLDLEREKKSREQILDLTRQQQAVAEVREATKKIDFDLKRSRIQGTVSMAEAYAGDDPLLRRRIEAEASIAQKRVELEEKYGKESIKAQEELRKFSDATRRSATELGLLDRVVTEFKERMNMIRETARTFTEGFKGFTKALVTGGDIREALVSMLQGISDKLLDTTLDAIFKPIEDALVRNLKDFFGVADPTAALQAENNQALGVNTAALDRLAAALNGGGIGSPAGFSAPANNLTFGSTTLPSTLPDFNTSLGNLTTGFGDAALTLDGFSTEAAFTSKQFLEFGKYTAANTQALGFFGKGLMSVLQGISGGGGGGGGIFGTILSIAGSFLGGLGGGGGSASTGLTSFSGGIVPFNPAAWSFRANGGPVSARSPYVVGERGPELFVPSSGGHIIPNNELGRGGSVSVVVNVDAKGSKVEGDDDRAKQLGAGLSAAIQQELIKQKRPGGLLS